MAPRLLIVDDEPEICDLLGRVGRESGYDVVTANDAEEFKVALGAGETDVIVLDLTLPGTDGIELLNYLAERRSRARILIVSGFDEGIRSMAYEIGAARGLDMGGVLPKPVRIAEFRALLGRFKDERRQE